MDELIVVLLALVTHPDRSRVMRSGSSLVPF
ncbi:hypothetical protein BZB76_1156 [Actinomadura pelletieri DSM 43383]|uniref:Uncharacterized protein n=1 Tax=Actinomadura pelletieri DSM 43383 TaxID=1120940 RepID=A0A495QZN4_9ACTN|nr:hypothetical protein BZB76_1156 [Actinomadura pelletieri DSM 43383]